MATTDPGKASAKAVRSDSRAWLVAAVAIVVLVGLLISVIGPDKLGGLVTTLRRSLPTRVVNIPAPGAANARAELETPALDAVNAARAGRGLPAVADDPTLLQVARSRSQDMAVKHYFAHTAPDGSDVFSLLDAAGYPWLSAGENLYLSTLRDGDGSINSAITFWSSSPAHAANMFSPTFTQAAIGAVEGSDGVYLTLVMAQR
jgi:uncharacterized protein YkwD